MQAPFWKSTNFWFNIFMLIGAFWGITTDTVNVLMGAVVAVVGAVGIARQFILNAKFGGFLPTLRQGNTLNYLATALALAGIPQAAELVPALSGLGEALITQNWGLVFSAGFTVINILIHIFKKKTPPATA